MMDRRAARKPKENISVRNLETLLRRLSEVPKSAPNLTRLFRRRLQSRAPRPSEQSDHQFPSVMPHW
jgi:hypothetical protein